MATSAQNRQRLINQYNAYAALLEERGIPWDPVSIDVLKRMQYSDLVRVVSEAKRLACIPPL